MASFLFANITITAKDNLHFKFIPQLNRLTAYEIICLYQDKEGYIWIGTNNGLFSYNGHSVTSFFLTGKEGEGLPHSEIRCMAEDPESRIWIGTRMGLAILDKKTGEINPVEYPPFKNTCVQCLLSTGNNRIWVGTENGLFYYDESKKKFHAFDNRKDGDHAKNDFYPYSSVTTLYEDEYGNVWIGTWADGLWRYDTQTQRFHAFPELGEKLSVSAIHADQWGQLWVGVWRKGLIRIEHPYQKPYVEPRFFMHSATESRGIPDNYIHSIIDNKVTKDLWMGTGRGLCILHVDENKAATFENYPHMQSEGKTLYNAIQAILRDREGNMWLGSDEGGVSRVDIQHPQFDTQYPLPEMGNNGRISQSVAALCIDNDDLLWLGSKSEGVSIIDRKSGKPFTEIAGLQALQKSRAYVPCIMQSPTTGKIWIGTHSCGVWIYDKKGRPGEKLTLWDWFSHSWIGSRVNDIMEDTKGNYWFATNTGLSMLDAKGKKHSFASHYLNGKRGSTYRFCQLLEDHQHMIWIASDNYGVTRINGNVTDTVPDMSFYLPANGKLEASAISCLLEDKRKRIWAASEVQGLFLYDKGTDSFFRMDEMLGLPGTAIFSMEEDNEGNLWLSTNVGLVKANIPDDISRAVYYLYTTDDGLQDNIFNRNASFKSPTGELLFGGNKGYNAFLPEKLKQDTLDYPVLITDIKLFNQSWINLDKKERNRISPLAPGFTRQITLNHKQNNFSIEFAALKFHESNDVQYAYLMEDVDKDWIHTDNSRPFAYYNNLKAGTYHFKLKANAGNKGWVEAPYTLEVRILPPLWLTPWAYLIYFFATVAIAWVIFRTLRNRILLHNEIRMRKIDNAKQEELIRLKLQFFTNITHELLTPLTIISAATDNLGKGNAPAKNYAIIINNVNRLIRNIQQILEFRKSETGHLKLKVSKGDLVLTIHNSVESIRPFAEKKQVQLHFECDEATIPAWFDPDKVDKMVYNLISNAIKYNRAKGSVWVKLKLLPDHRQVTLTVTDNGEGMTPEQLDKLFSLFYEGEYRRFNTTGTGIGLALTQSLVNLHHGTISVESRVGEGSTFTILLPTDKQVYTPEETDEASPVATVPLSPVPVAPKEEGKLPTASPVAHEKKYSLLVVEDDTELLGLIEDLLDVDYDIFTAENGREALEVLKGQSIDLIISDIMMPEMDGIALCKAVKDNMETCDIPVLLLTAKNQQQDQIEAFNSGASAFISKPFNMSLLAARISNLLKARERTNRKFKKQFVFEAKELEYTSMDEAFIEKAFDCIQRHLDDTDYSQNDFINDMGVSRSTAFRKLKSLTGLTYTDFVKNVRLKAACRIMEEKKNIRISELAYAVGFSDPKYFSLCFKKEFGIVPTEYVQRNSPEE